MPLGQDLRDFREQRFADGAPSVIAALRHAAEGCSRLLAQALETLHDWRVHQAEREIHRCRRMVRVTSH